MPTDPRLSVVATSEIFPHVALRSHAYLPWAAPSSPVDYYILDLRDAYPITDQQLRQRATVWLANANYQILLQQDDVVVLKQGYRALPVTANADFGNTIRLLGYAAQADNGTLDLQLIWRAERIIGDQYHYFVHLVDNQGRTYSQQDGPPIAGAPASFTWTASLPLRADETLQAPPPAQWSHYHLEVGWYDWRTNQHLLLANGSDHATLQLPG